MSAIKRSNLAFILFPLIGVLGGAFAIYAAVDPSAGDKIEDFMNNPQVMPWAIGGMILLFFVLPMVLGFGPFIKKAIENSKKKQRLMQVGQKTQAKILEVRDTGLTVNNNPYIEITVEVQGVHAVFQVMVSRVGIPRPGDVIEVIYDPADPTQVMPANG